MMRLRSLQALTVAVLSTATACSSDAGSTDAAGQLDASIEFFEHRLSAHPDDVLSPAALVDRYLMRFGLSHDIQDIADADSILRSAIGLHPKQSGLWTRAAAVHIARHEFPEALAAAQRGYELAPRRSNNGPLFDAFFEVGEWDSALVALKRMPARHFATLIRQARLAEGIGRYDLADRALFQACRPEQITEARLSAWCNVRRADVAQATGDGARAHQFLVRALSDVPDYMAALVGLAESAEATGDLEGARILWQRVAAQPGGVEAHLRLARLEEPSGNQRRALGARERFERRAADARYGRAYWSLLAIHYAETGRMAQARALADRDLGQRPGPESFYTLAKIQFLDTALVEADASLRKALTWAPRDAQLLALRDTIAGLLGPRS